jgi:hypothetical protein
VRSLAEKIDRDCHIWKPQFVFTSKEERTECVRPVVNNASRPRAARLGEGSAVTCTTSPIGSSAASATLDVVQEAFSLLMHSDPGNQAGRQNGP